MILQALKKIGNLTTSDFGLSALMNLVVYRKQDLNSRPLPPQDRFLCFLVLNSDF